VVTLRCPNRSTNLIHVGGREGRRKDYDADYYDCDDDDDDDDYETAPIT
jgi:hypothetical protein